MSFARFLETGAGAVAIRLSIEGLPYEFVSDPAMEITTSDGRQRICALPPMGKGIVLDESVNLPEAKLEGRAVSITIDELKGDLVAKCFAWRPDIERFLASTIEVADTDVPLLSATGLSADSIIHIGTEAMLVLALVDANTLSVSRGYWDTIPQKHWSNDATGVTQYRSVHNRPLRIRGRRARVFAYGSADSILGDGTQIWLGQVTSEPRCDEAGSQWRLQIGSIAERLKGKLGGQLDVPTSPRGIYYSWACPLRIQFAEDHGSGLGASGGFFTDMFVGFYETQEEFCEALTTFLSTSASTIGTAIEAGIFLFSSLRAIVVEGGLWTIEVACGAGVVGMQLDIYSALDGTVETGEFVDVRGNRILSYGAGVVAYPKWMRHGRPVGAQTVPRGYYGVPALPMPGADQLSYYAHAERSTWPERRVYVDRAVAVDWEDVVAKWPADGSFGAFEGTQGVWDSDTAENWVQLEPSTESDGGMHLYNASVLPTFSPMLTLARGSLADLRDALVVVGPEQANRGVAPFLTSEDLADWSAIIDALPRRRWLTDRRWSLAQSVDLEEVLSHECRLLSVFPIIDSDGKISIAPLEIPNAATVIATSIDDEIISAGWSSMERGGQTINRVVLKTGYDPREDDWTGRVLDVIDATSYSYDHEDRPLEIEPRSTAGVDTTSADGPVFLEERIGAEDIAEAFLPVLALFGYPHDFVSVNVSWKLFHLLLGDFVSFNAIHLPDYRFGVRPIAAVSGIVVGRKWELGQAYGVLRILISWANVAGYAPTARIASAINVTGNQWDLTISQTAASSGSVGLYAPAGTVPEQFFAVGHAVRIEKYDSEDAGAITGVVDGVNTTTHVIRVSFDEVWTPGTDVWELEYQLYDSVVESQKIYAFIADETGMLDADSPRTYGP